MSVDHFSQLGLSLELRAEAEQLRQSLQARPSVDVAKGMLMALYGYDEQAAFAELRRVSQAHRVGMAELAVALVHLVCGPEGAGGITGDRTALDVDARAAEAVRAHWEPTLGPAPAGLPASRGLVGAALGTATNGARHLPFGDSAAEALTRVGALRRQLSSVMRAPLTS